MDWDELDADRPAPWFRRPAARWVAVIVAVSIFAAQIIGRFG